MVPCWTDEAVEGPCSPEQLVTGHGSPAGMHGTDALSQNVTISCQVGGYGDQLQADW